MTIPIDTMKDPMGEIPDAVIDEAQNYWAKLLGLPVDEVSWQVVFVCRPGTKRKREGRMTENAEASDVREIELRRPVFRSPGQERISKEWWEPTPLYCIECGGQPVWVESDEGDYYQGPDYFCLSCLCTFKYPSGCSFGGNMECEKLMVRQRAELLKSL